jgi:hypothetical protein
MSGSTTGPDTAPGDTADRVVLTYAVDDMPDDLRFWVHDELTGETFGASFRSRHDAVHEGDRFEEFVSRGCGVPVDVILRVDAVAGGTRLDSGTEIIVERTD